MHVFIEGMMIQDVPYGRYWKPKPAPQQRGPQQAGQKRAKKWHLGTQALREIRHYQRMTKLCIPKLAFIW